MSKLEIFYLSYYFPTFLAFPWCYWKKSKILQFFFIRKYFFKKKVERENSSCNRHYSCFWWKQVALNLKPMRYQLHSLTEQGIRDFDALKLRYISVKQHILKFWKIKKNIWNLCQKTCLLNFRDISNHRLFYHIFWYKKIVDTKK